MKIIGNYVLFEPFWDSEQIDFSGNVMKIDPTYQRGLHQPVRGKVMAVPNRLRYGDSVMLDWDTPMELLPGDEIVVNYNEMYAALHSYRRSFVMIEGKKCVFVRYDKINVAKRGDKIIPVNGYVIIEPIPPTTLDALENPYLSKNSRDRLWGVVRYVGSRNRKYFFSDTYKDDFDPEPGDVVGMSPHSDLFVESPVNPLFFDGRTMVKVQRPYILSVIDGVKVKEK